MNNYTLMSTLNTVYQQNEQRQDGLRRDGLRGQALQPRGQAQQAAALDTGAPARRALQPQHRGGRAGARFLTNTLLTIYMVFKMLIRTNDGYLKKT